MQRAMDETTRRRKKQQAHNEANNITPKGVVKPIVDILEYIQALSEQVNTYQYIKHT
jgi:excinuclease ABC subunit B